MSVLQDKSMEISELNTKINSCILCALSKGRKNAVPGEGKVPADLMILGEAPGKFEDIAGRPFIGMSGKFLTKYLEKAGIRREEVFVTNAVKCRPPNNRKPKAEEIETCRPYLISQISIVKPKLILALGVSASSSLGMSFNHLSEIRGKITDVSIGGRNVKVYVTFHPSFPMRFPKAREDFLNDLVKVKDFVMR
ncbi:MAG: uracil-DNA glycosylase [Candidatus Acidifodinimicrobium sp.]